MELDITARGGRADLPVCIFVHGLGMNKTAWTNPAKARIMGGLLPMTALCGDHSPPFRTLFQDMASSGHSVIAWSQRRPVGPMEEAVEELRAVADLSKGMPHRGIILIGHSRGGLIAKYFLKKYPLEPPPPPKKKMNIPFLQKNNGGDAPETRALVTISTPHKGSNMARWASYLSPLFAHIDPLIPEEGRGRLSEALERISGFLQSPGVRELIPGSETLLSLERFSPEGFQLFSAGGTNPSFLGLYGIRIPEVLEKILPDRTTPEEIREGGGDGLVSAQSASMPSASLHLNFHLNHAAILVDPDARKTISERFLIKGLLQVKPA